MNINVLNVCLDPLLFLCRENIQTFSLISISVNLAAPCCLVPAKYLRTEGREVTSQYYCESVMQSSVLTVALCLPSINYEL